MQVFTEEVVNDLISLMGLEGVKKFAQASYENLGDADREFARLFSMEADLLHLFTQDSFNYSKFCNRLDFQLEFVKFCVEHNLQLGYYYHEGDLDKKNLNEPLMLRKMIHTPETNARLLSLKDRESFLSEEDRRDLEQGMELLAKVDSAYRKDAGIRKAERISDIVYQSHHAVRKEYETPQMMVKQYMASLKAAQAAKVHKSKKESTPTLAVEANRVRERPAQVDNGVVIDQEGIDKLEQSIKKMRDYGTHLLNDERDAKGQKILNLCDVLEGVVRDIRNSKTLQKLDENKIQFTKALKEGSKAIAVHRKEWKTYAANALIALTGVGVFVLIGRVIYGLATADSLLFFSKSKSKELAEGVEARLEKLSYRGPR